MSGKAACVLVKDTNSRVCSRISKNIATYAVTQRALGVILWNVQVFSGEFQTRHILKSLAIKVASCGGCFQLIKLMHY